MTVDLRPGEVQGDVVGIGPKVQIAGDQFAAVIDPDRLGITGSLADALQGLKDILTAISEPCVGGGAVARMRVHNGQDAQFLARRELVVNENHSPELIGTNRRLAVIPELCLYAPLGMLVA